MRKPSRISIVVVLPAPLGPSRANTSPRLAVKVTPASTSLVPYLMRRSRTSSASAGVSLLGSIAAPIPYVAGILYFAADRYKPHFEERVIGNSRGGLERSARC